MTRLSFGAFGTFARAAIVAATAFIAGCGSGAVSAPPVPPVIGPIVITPSTATLYSDTPTTFIITGGNGSYIVSSSDQSALPIVGVFTGGNQLTIVPNPVAADTPVTLTVRDTGTSTPVTAALIVKPKTVSNVVTVTPSTNDCGSAICSAGDAEVSVKLALNGLPLANRTVRFDVVSGNFAVITSPPGSTETTSLSGTTTTDASGFARMRIRAAVDAPSQTGLLQITDTGSGSTQRVSFLIAQNTGASAGFFVTPSSVSFAGPNNQQCSDGTSADIYIFGGVPPYSVSNSFPQFIAVSTTFIQSSGGRFTITTQGGCLDTGNLTVRDSAGRTSAVSVTNGRGSDAVPALAVAPANVTLSDCTGSATVTIAGGRGPGFYTATSGSGSVDAIPSGSTVIIRRHDPSSASSSPVTVGVSDGVSTATVTVNLTGAGAGACPTPPGGGGPSSGSLVANPSSITLTDCTTNQSFQVSGGTPTFGGYSAIANGNSFTFQQIQGNNNTSTFFVRRATASPAPSGAAQSITVSDGNGQTTVPVSFSGAGALTCP